MDVFTRKKRSEVMSRIRGRDTVPEQHVRSVLHRAGLRFCLHRKDLPGRPDIVLPAARTVVFVHGCFWHGHAGCRLAVWPRTNAEFWRAKIEGNRARDARAEAALTDAGWTVETVWECELAGERVTSLARVLIERREALRHARGITR